MSDSYYGAACVYDNGEYDIFAFCKDGDAAPIGIFGYIYSDIKLEATAMNQKVKTIISAILCIALSAGLAATAFAAQATAELYNVYGDSMLFEQNKEAVFAGTGTLGSTVSCKLLDENDAEIQTAQAIVDNNGEFRLSFIAPAGGYKEYTVKFYVNQAQFRVLQGVVFGEMWLASGQSNMQYALNLSDTYEQNKTGSEWLRFFYIEPFATYNGSTEEFPLEAQKDIEAGSCYWLKGNNDNVGNISAVSFFFAKKLQAQLDMPVGVLMPNLGGSMLASWLSRETIDSDASFAAYLKEKDMYAPAESWYSNADVWHSTMTVNYNKKIAPLRNFAVSGMIWYQGESEILTGWDIGYYEKGLELLQGSYSELFGCENTLPFIAAQLAPFAYGENKYNLHNNEFVDFQQKDPASRSVVPIYDLSLDYVETFGLLHPSAKQPVAERMVACAMNMVYGESDCFTAATVESTRVDGSNFYVTLRDTGDGLTASGNQLRGFALCETGGVYVQAEAEIVSADTIKIYSEEVKSPVAATYAFAQNNNSANVYSTLNGKIFLPVAPFTTDVEKDRLYWEDPAFASCDSDSAWLISGDIAAGINKLWSAENAQITIDSDTQFAGEGCLNIVADEKAGKFSLSPVFTYKKDRKEKYFDHMLVNWSCYSAVSVMVRNNGTSDVTVDKMRVYSNKFTWYAPQIDASGNPDAVIPADGQWHKLTFDLNTLYLFGNECGTSYSRRLLDNIHGFELNFSCDKQQGADLSIDEFRFTADSSEGSRVRIDDVSLANADNLFELISAIFTICISIIISMFSE